MITPSLVSMVLHSVWATSEILRSDESYAGMGQLIDRLYESLQRFRPRRTPRFQSSPGRRTRRWRWATSATESASPPPIRPRAPSSGGVSRRTCLSAT